MNEKPLEWIAECGESMGHRLGRFASLGAAVALLDSVICTDRAGVVCRLVRLDADACIFGV